MALISFLRVELLNLETVKVKGVKHPVKMRKDTTDRFAFHEVFLVRSYNIYRNSKIMIDAGSKIGFTSIFFAEKLPESRIYTIEPSDANFEVLLRNTKSSSNYNFRSTAFAGMLQLYK